MTVTIHNGDCLDLMASDAIPTVDLVFTSPPYEAARTYGIDFKLRGQEWVDWAHERFTACLSVCRGLVAWVVEGQTRKYRYSATPALLMADLHRAGVNLRKPPIYMRHGIPGSGGPDWLKNNWEWIICATKPGRLPWSEPTACGHPPKHGPGGAPSHRTVTGARVRKVQTRRKTHGERARDGQYQAPKLANPGNIIDCGAAGGGNIGSKLAHENEAPFPEKLAEFFIKSFCPPGGTVLDPFCGSGTTLAVAERLGRNAIGIDVRESQVTLSHRRVKEHS